MDLKRVKNIRQKDKDLTFGYIRKAQTLLYGANTSNYNIPEIISYLVVLYLHLFEYFECYDPDLEISDDRMMLTCTKPDKRGGDEAYGHIVLNNTLNWNACLWRFKIHFTTDILPFNCAKLNIGLMATECIDDCNEKLYYDFSIHWQEKEGSINSWSNDEYSGCLYSPSNRDLDQLICDGDEIILGFEMKDQLLDLYVNGKPFYQSIKMKMRDGMDYKLTVSLTTGRSITLTEFVSL